MGRMLDALKRIESRTPEALVPAEEKPADPVDAASEPIALDAAPIPDAARPFAFGEDDDPLRDHATVESLLAEAQRATAEALGDVDAEAQSDCGDEGELPDPLGGLAETVLRCKAPGQPACFLFTSPDSDGLGADLLVPLSMSLARRLDSELLLIDTNLRRPALAARLGVETSRGLTDVLTGAATWQDVVRRTVLPGVALLPAVAFSTPAGPPPDRLNLRELLADARKHYPLILVHASSLKHPEVVPMARHCEGVYLMVRLHSTTRRAAAEAVPILRRARANLLGCVVVQ